MVLINIVDKFVRNMDVPEMGNISKISIICDDTLIIENFESISEYTDELIIICLKDKNVKIRGLNLNIQYLTDSIISIGGKIFSVDFFGGT